MTPGEYIKELRKSNNISQEKLSEDLNFDRSTIAKYENNINQMKYDVIKIFADYFDEPIINIISGNNKAYNNITISNDEYLKNYYLNVISNYKTKNKYNVLKILILFITIILSLLYINLVSINKYQKIKSFTLQIEDSTIKTSTSIIVDSFENIYIYLDELSINSNDNNIINSITLYYKENNENYFIFQKTGNNLNSISIIDNYEEQKYVDFTKKDIILNNLYIRIKTNTNQIYNSKINIHELKQNNHILSNVKKIKYNYKLEEKINYNIYDINTSIQYNNYTYFIYNENERTHIKCKENGTDILIDNKVYIGTFNKQSVAIYILNIKDDELKIYNEINNILSAALNNK